MVLFSRFLRHLREKTIEEKIQKMLRFRFEGDPKLR